MTSLAPILQAFFTEHLAQRRSSAHTVAAYRDAFRLLPVHAQRELATNPARLQVEQINADFVAGFLHHLENERGNTVSTRNARLAAIAALPRTRPAHPAGPGHPDRQAAHPDSQLSDPRGDRSTAGSAQSGHLSWPP